MGDRFDYDVNLTNATRYHGYLNPFWPPAWQYSLSSLDLKAYEPVASGPWHDTLAQIRSAIEFEWLRVKRDGASGRGRFNETTELLDALENVRQYLSLESDHEALNLRMQAIRLGYTNEILQRLGQLKENVTVVAAHISTWYGKDIGRLPTAFACKMNGLQQSFVDTRATPA